MKFQNFMIDGISYDTYKEVPIIKPKEFNAYKKKLEEEGRYVSIIRNTRLKENNKEDYDGDLFIIDSQKEYISTEEKSRSAKGYICVGDDKFIRVEERFPLLLILLFGVLLLLLGVMLYHMPTAPTDTGNIVIDDSATEYTGEQSDTDTSGQESIEIPGYYKFISSENASIVQLYNPEVNTVYFKYAIYNVLDSRTDKVFTATYEIPEGATEEEKNQIITDARTENYVNANAYAKELQLAYVESKSDGKYYFTLSESGERVNTIELYKAVKESDDVYSILCEEVELVFLTDSIAPGKQVEWDTYSSLGKGEYNLKFKIDTHDVETLVQCHGAIQTVTGIVK